MKVVAAYYGIVLLILVLTVSGQKEFPPYDGWFNNRMDPSSGTPDSPLSRELTSHYTDGVYQPSGLDRPSPRDVSSSLMSGPPDLTSFDEKTVLFVYFGQHVINDIVDVERNGCPPERYGIKISYNDTELNPLGLRDLEMPYERSRYDDSNTGYSPNRPRNQINEVTSFLDGSSIYGHGRTWANQLRSFGECPKSYESDCKGELRSSDDEGKFPMLNFPGLPIYNPAIPASNKVESTARFYATGSRLSNENPFLLSISVVWFRHHNYLAKKLRTANPVWSEQRVFEEARTLNIAIYQNIVYYEWLPVLLGTNVPKYEGYKSSTSVAISNVFQSAAIRYLYTLVPSGGNVRSNEPGKCSPNGTAVRLCQSYYRSEEIIRVRTLEGILLGMCNQLAEREDHVITHDLRNAYHGPLEFSRRDLMALSVQTGRDHGLPDYNTALEELGFNRTNFASNAMRDELMEMYKSSTFENVDILVGGLLDINPDKANPSPLFSKIIRNQFQRIRDGDRFWFENVKNGLFDDNAIEEISNTSFRDVLLRVMTSDYRKDIQELPFKWKPTESCQNYTQVFIKDLERCSDLHLYDYFEDSEISFIVVWTAVGVACVAAILISRVLAAFCRRRKNIYVRAALSKRDVTAQEVLGSKKQNVKITFKDGAVVIKSQYNQREINLTKNRTVEVWSSNNYDRRHLLVRLEKESYDLVLKFADETRRDKFYADLNRLCDGGSLTFADKGTVSKRSMLEMAVTKETRDNRMELFFNNALRMTIGQDGLDSDQVLPELANAKLSQHDVAEVFRISHDSTFLDKIFEHSSYDGDMMTYKDFCRFLTFFSKGQPRQKAKLLFELYDVSKQGHLNKNEFISMVKSILTIVGEEKITHISFDEIIMSMMTSMQRNQHNHYNFEDFEEFVKRYDISLCKSFLQPGRDLNRNTVVPESTELPKITTSFSSPRGSCQYTMSRLTTRESHDPVIMKRNAVGMMSRRYRAFCRLVEQYCTHVFWISLYTLITAGVFAYAFNEVVSNKTSGLNSMAGYPLAVARASAGALQFNFSTILLTVCRNIITFMRATWVARFVPFDSAMTTHRIAAWMGLFFSVMHTVAHGINFYSIPTQSPSDMLCYFSDLWWPSNFIPSFVFWAFQTITGVTGVVLCVVLLLMYVFAMDFARRLMYQVFHWTHIIGIFLLYILIVLHGSAMLVQKPGFYLYFLGPATLYTLDKMYSLCRRKTPVAILNAELLPSNVLYLEIQRPRNFHYKSGQWVQIACPEISPRDYHPFTLSSAPNQSSLMLHIRSVGPWTKRLCKVYNTENNAGFDLPKIYLDGPFGEGHQDWPNYKVSVLIGAGIGVTPFASILKDLVHTTTMGPDVACKRVYFIWLARDHRQFEWLLDIIKDAEDGDERGILRTHLFITQFPHKYDLRTTMTYACEKHFQKTEGRSMFTGLKAVTHFGRPDWFSLLETLRKDQKQDFESIRKIGVFTCGPANLSKEVDETCTRLSKKGKPVFVHQYENF